MSIELPATFRHRRDMTERVLEATLSLNKINKKKPWNFLFSVFQVEICSMDENLMSYPRLRGSFRVGLDNDHNTIGNCTGLFTI